MRINPIEATRLNTSDPCAVVESQPNPRLNWARRQDSVTILSMTYPPRLSRRAAFYALFYFAFSLAAADRRPISETDIFSFQWIADPQISPDGSRIAYVHVNVNSKHDG